MTTRYLAFTTAERALIADALAIIDPGSEEDYNLAKRLKVAFRPAPPRARDWRAEMAADLRTWLLDEMGMEGEAAGGGCIRLSHAGSGGWSLILTDVDGTDLPTWDRWAVGVYPPVTDNDEATEAVLLLYSTDKGASSGLAGITLRQAVAAGCAAIAAAVEG